MGSAISAEQDSAKLPTEEDFYSVYHVKTRKRTSRHQFRVLEDHFAHNPKPSATMRKDIASQLEMTARGVQVWFQNRRAKAKAQLMKEGLAPAREPPILNPSEARQSDLQMAEPGSQIHEAEKESELGRNAGVNPNEARELLTKGQADVAGITSAHGAIPDRRSVGSIAPTESDLGRTGEGTEGCREGILATQELSPSPLPLVSVQPEEPSHSKGLNHQQDDSDWVFRPRKLSPQQPPSPQIAAPVKPFQQSMLSKARKNPINEPVTECRNTKTGPGEYYDARQHDSKNRQTMSASGTPRRSIRLLWCIIVWAP